MRLSKTIKTLISIKKVCTGLFPPLEQTALSEAIKILKKELKHQKEGEK